MLLIIRPANCLLALVSVLVGSVLTTGDPRYYPVAMAALATFFICGAGNIHNDLIDLNSDRQNHPERTLVTSAVSRQQAIGLASVLTFLALVLSFSAGLTVFLIVMGATLILLGYNLYLSKLPLVGNITVAVLAGLTFLVGGAAIDGGAVWKMPGPLIPTIFAFFFHLPREIIKDCEDIGGDKTAGAKSLGSQVGIKTAVRVAFALFLAGVPLTIIPYIAGWYSLWYAIIVAGIDISLCLILLWAIRQPGEKRLRVASRSLKIGMAIGVVALLLA